MALSVGTKAPPFNAPTNGNRVFKMEDMLGKKLALYFYSTDDTETCTLQACQFRDNIDLLNEEGITVVGVSPDTVESHNKFAKKYNLPFTLIADPELKVCTLYDAWREKTLFGKTYMGIIRTTYLIDENGIIRRVWENVRLKNHIQAIVSRQ